MNIVRDFIEAKPLERVAVQADVFDPDNDSMKIDWEIYPQYNQYNGKALPLRVWDSNSTNTYFTIPEDAQPGDHFMLILRACDVNETPMTSYGVIRININ